MDDETTRDECPRCKGNGVRVTFSRLDTGGARVTSEGVHCWLCEGTGAVTHARVVWWTSAGKPVDDPSPNAAVDDVMIDAWLKGRKRDGDGD